MPVHDVRKKLLVNKSAFEHSIMIGSLCLPWVKIHWEKGSLHLLEGVVVWNLLFCHKGNTEDTNFQVLWLATHLAMVW